MLDMAVQTTFCPAFLVAQLTLEQLWMCSIHVAFPGSISEELSVTMSTLQHSISFFFLLLHVMAKTFCFTDDKYTIGLANTLFLWWWWLICDICVTVINTLTV